ncbi:MAG: hydroxyacid dehydrogenase [Eubacterium sp.]|nr:hydroxyacid dehydrogenase [Eubacterium sp.]
MKILVLGGDKRCIYAAGELARTAQVDMFALAGHNARPAGKYDCVLLGLPCSRDNVTVNAPMYDRTVTLEEAVGFVRGGGMLLGGMLCPSLLRLCDEKGVRCEDYYRRESFILKNAVPSAEGALAVGINSTEGQIMGAEVLITGYGRIASLLAKYLSALCANVTVVCRSEEQRTKALINGLKAIDFPQLGGEMKRFSLVYNTVPAEVIGGYEISNAKKGAVYVELASSSGIDLAEANRYGLAVINAQGLPAKTAPQTAGRIIAEEAESILKSMNIE